jgi:hypothetical protein
MRKVIVLSFVSLDGVIQSPGGPEEDTSGGFAYGGWIGVAMKSSHTNIMERAPWRDHGRLSG